MSQETKQLSKERLQQIEGLREVIRQDELKHNKLYQTAKRSGKLKALCQQKSKWGVHDLH
jgi:hypothetical protein